MNNDLIYLDHAAATPLDERVLDAMLPYLKDHFYNPSSPYAPAVSVRRDYEQARHNIASCIGAKADEIIITAGATESINLAFSVVSGHVITSHIEHHAVLAAAHQYDQTLITVDDKGIPDLMSLAASIQPNTQLISIALANNELGTIQPLREIVDIVQKERLARRQVNNKTPLYVHCDASQGVGQLDVHVARLGVDMITINAGKIYGPKQVALLWVRSGVQVQAQIVGGGQERGLRSGTENVAGIIGFARALQLVTDHRKYESDRLETMRNAMQKSLTEAFPDSIVSGNMHRRLVGHLHISFPNLDAERLIFTLESRGILVATGSACAANKGTRSHVLTAIGLPDYVADGSVRITLGHLSTEQNIQHAAVIIIEEVKREYERIKK